MRNSCQAVFKESLKSPWLWQCSFCISSSPEEGHALVQKVCALNTVCLIIYTRIRLTIKSGSGSYANSRLEICLFDSWISLYSCYIFFPCCRICVCVCVIFVSLGKKNPHTRMQNTNTQCDKHCLSVFVRDGVIVRRRERRRERERSGGGIFVNGSVVRRASETRHSGEACV